MKRIGIIFLFTLTMMLSGLSSRWTHAAVKGTPAKENGEVLQASGQTNAPAGTPTREIQDIEIKMETYKTGDNLSPAEKANNVKIKRDILSGAFDIRELSRLALAQHWNKLAAGEQNNFVALMTDLLETKAIFSKEQSKTKGKKYIVKYLGDSYANDKTKAKTLTKVIVPKQDVKIDIEYKLKKDPGGWKIYDVVVDDASLVDNYRYQFDNIITKHGYSELVRRMREKLNELRSKS